MMDVLGTVILAGLALSALLILIGPAIKIIPQWERGVVLRFGRQVATRGPGFNLIIPWVDTLLRVDMRTQTWVMSDHQEVITRDNVTVHVDAVVYFNVLDPVKAVVNVVDYRTATEQLALTTLRSVLGQSDLDELLAHRDRVNERLREIIDQHTEAPWGVRASLVEVRDVQLPADMQRVMASQAEAEREKRAKVIHAHGELQAAKTLKEAADIIARQPISLQLRYLQAMVEMAGEKSATIIPLPIDLMGHLGRMFTGNNSEPTPVQADERSVMKPARPRASIESEEHPVR
jgi:regulator of protease activity HflC (stomatin/prohibitin superfamily)